MRSIRPTSAAFCLLFVACLASLIVAPRTQAAELPPGWEEKPQPGKHLEVCRGTFVWRPLAPASAELNAGDLQLRAVEILRSEDSLSLSGEVEVIRGNATLLSGSAVYDEKRKQLLLGDKVEFSHPQLLAVSTSAEYRPPPSGAKRKRNRRAAAPPEGYLKLEEGVFSQPDSQLHGRAAVITYNNSIILLDDATISFCDPTEDSWSISGKRIRLNLNTGQGRARGAKFNIKDRPVMYFPYLPFPVGDKRQSGFLFPNLDFTSANGFIYTQPVYLNLAANYDSTIYANFIQQRGLLWEQDLRWLTKAGSGRLGFGYIQRDALQQQERALQFFKFASTVNRGWSGDVTWNGISDNDYIRDLPTIIEDRSDLILPRNAKLRYADRWVDWTLGLRDYQLIAAEESQFIQPYAALPYTNLGLYAALGKGFYLDNLLDYTLFNLDADEALATSAAERQNVFTGDNGRAANELTLGWRGYSHWGRTNTRVSWQGLAYQLNDRTRRQVQTAPDDALGSADNETVGRNHYYFDYDSSLIFSRYINSVSCDCYWTLEPRFYGLAARQDFTAGAAGFAEGLSFFDTGPALVTYDYLFSPNRYRGLDTDAAERRVSLGMESRLLNSATGRGYTLRIGQVVANAVDDPATPSNINPSGINTSAAELTNVWAADFSWAFARRGHLKLDLGGGGGQEGADNSLDFYGLSLHYKGAKKSGVSLIYRKQELTFYQSAGNQLANNFVWYLVPRWSLFAGWRYDFTAEKLNNSVSGFGYENCCFKTRVGYFQKDNQGRAETGASITFSFIPLGSVGSSNTVGAAVISGGSISDIYDEFK